MKLKLKGVEFDTLNIAINGLSNTWGLGIITFKIIRKYSPKGSDIYRSRSLFSIYLLKSISDEEIRWHVHGSLLFFTSNMYRIK